MCEDTPGRRKMFSIALIFSLNIFYNIAAARGGVSGAALRGTPRRVLLYRARFARLRPHRVHRLPAQNAHITSQSTQIHSQSTQIHSEHPPTRPRRAHRRPPTLPRIRRTINLEHPQANKKPKRHTYDRSQLPSSPGPSSPARVQGGRVDRRFFFGAVALEVSRFST